jgi:hypothetical protein
MKRLLTLIIGLLLCSASYSQQYMYMTVNYSNPSHCCVGVIARYIKYTGVVSAGTAYSNVLAYPGIYPCSATSQVLRFPYDTTIVVTRLTTSIGLPTDSLCTCGTLFICNTHINVYHNPVITIPWCWDGTGVPNYWYMTNGFFIPCDWSNNPPCGAPVYNPVDDTTKIPNGYHGQVFGVGDSINVPSSINDVVLPNKKVIRITDELGRESKPEPNKLYIYTYSDGTVERKIIIKD